MNYKRILPLFLLKGMRLVKGTNFRKFTDVGDPISQALIFDAQGADEVAIVDIDASKKHSIIDSNIITQLVNKCRLPLAAGGGITSVEDAMKCFNAGADKIIINSYAVLRPNLVKELAKEFGSQSILVSIDVKREQNGEYYIYIFSGERRVDIKLNEYLNRIIASGAGEVLISSLDREGTLSGFDLELYKSIQKNVTVPLIASGGAGCYSDLETLFRETQSDAAAIGKMLFLRDYDIVRIKAFLSGKKISVRDA